MNAKTPQTWRDLRTDTIYGIAEGEVWLANVGDGNCSGLLRDGDGNESVEAWRTDDFLQNVGSMVGVERMREYPGGGVFASAVVSGASEVLLSHGVKSATMEADEAVVARIIERNTSPDGVAKALDIAGLLPIIREVQELISAICGGQTPAQIAASSENPTPEQRSMHWKACVASAKRHIRKKWRTITEDGVTSRRPHARLRPRELAALRHADALEVFNGNEAAIPDGVDRNRIEASFEETRNR